MAKKPKTKAGKKRKVHKVMKEYKSGTLKSGSGRKVKSRRYALAVQMERNGGRLPPYKVVFTRPGLLA